MATDGSDSFLNYWYEAVLPGVFVLWPILMIPVACLAVGIAIYFGFPSTLRTWVLFASLPGVVLAFSWLCVEKGDIFGFLSDTVGWIPSNLISIFSLSFAALEKLSFLNKYSAGKFIRFAQKALIALIFISYFYDQIAIAVMLSQSSDGP